MSQATPPGADEDPLRLEPEAMRRLGYRTVDMLVERLADPAAQPPLRVASPEEMRTRLSGSAPAQGLDFETILAELEDHVLPFVSNWGHPGYFAFIPGPGPSPEHSATSLPVL